MEFQEIIDLMEQAEEYSELYEAASYIVDKELREQVEALISECEDDGDDVSVAYSVVASDLLDSKVNELNESKKVESKSIKQDFEDYCNDKNLDSSKKSSVDKYLNDYAKHYTQMNGIQNLEKEMNKVRKELQENIKWQGKTFTESKITDYISEEELDNIIKNNSILNVAKSYKVLDGDILEITTDMGKSYYKVVKGDDSDTYEAYWINKDGEKLGDSFVIKESFDSDLEKVKQDSISKGLYSESKLSNEERYQLRKYNERQYGVYDLETEKFLQKGSLKVIQGALQAYKSGRMSKVEKPQQETNGYSLDVKEVKTESVEEELPVEDEEVAVNVKKPSDEEIFDELKNKEEPKTLYDYLTDMIGVKVSAGQLNTRLQALFGFGKIYITPGELYNADLDESQELVIFDDEDMYTIIYDIIDLDAGDIEITDIQLD